MNYSFTGIFYLFGTIAMIAMVFKIADVYKEQKTDFAKFLLYGFSSFLICFFIVTVTTLFFTSSPLALQLTAAIGGIFFQSLAVIFLVRAFFPIVFPKIPPRLIQGFIILSTLVIEILYFQSNKIPFLEPAGFINWNIPPLVGAIRVLIMITFFIPALIVFSRQVKSGIKKIRKKAIIFIVLFVMGFIFLILFSTIFKTSGISEAIMLPFIIFILWSLITWTKELEEPKLIKKV